MRLPRKHLLTFPAFLAAGTLALAGCAAVDDPPADPAPAATSEIEAPAPRLAVLHDSGVLVLDAASLETLADVPVDGAMRIAEAGDGRHVMVTTERGFSVLDGGAWTESHGDHGHSFTAPPRLTGIEFPMASPGHVVSHDGLTALFSDGDGTVTVFEAHGLADGVESRTVELRAPHHGVAVPLAAGALVVTDGDESSRSSVVALDPDGDESARTDDCPGVHGEAVTPDGHIVFGCTGSVSVFSDGAFGSIRTPDGDAGIGDLRASSESPIVLADYATQDDADPDRVALIDPAVGTMTLVELPSTYYYWSLARGPHGEALVLGTDGALYVIDPESAALLGGVPVVAPWEPPSDWRDPAPGITVIGHTAFVTDPETASVHAVELDTLEISRSASLDGRIPVFGAAIRG